MISGEQPGIPLDYDSAYEGERVRDEDLYCEIALTEWVTSVSREPSSDGRVKLSGEDIGNNTAGTRLRAAIIVEVAGEQMLEEYEPVLERQINRLFNFAGGIAHNGQRNSAVLRVSRQAAEKGFSLSHLGTILQQEFRQEFESIIDTVEVRITTVPAEVEDISRRADEVYRKRDERTANLTDEDVDTFYSCTICQSVNPSHACILTPERGGHCGMYGWFDAKAASRIQPYGPNSPIVKGGMIDERNGQWQGVNEFIARASWGKIDHLNLYSLIDTPVPLSVLTDCIIAVLPMCNGVMIVDRDHKGGTPCGMSFSELRDTIDGGAVTPGFTGYYRNDIIKRKFISGDGGLSRLAWMPADLKKEMRELLNIRGLELDIPDFADRIADETVGVTEEEILPYLINNGHPAPGMAEILR